jgi:hypothetical protein
MRDPANLPALLQSFFTTRLMAQRKVSPHTIASYRDTFRLLLQFAQKRLHKAPSQLGLDNLDASLVLLGHKKHSDVELFCGITPLRARPTRKTLRGIYRGPGDSRGARRPASTLEELLQGIALARGTQEH